MMLTIEEPTTPFKQSMLIIFHKKGVLPTFCWELYETISIFHTGQHLP